MAIDKLPAKVLGAVDGWADRPAHSLSDGANGIHHLTERGGSDNHEVDIAGCRWRSARERPVDERIVDAVCQRQERSLKLRCYSCSLVEQPLQLREARMTAIRPVVDQIRLAALLDHAGTQERQELPPQTARA
jgi:hypothetical protein